MIYVASQPKAGTFFIAPVLAKLGYHWTKYHLLEDGAIDLRRSTPAQIKAGKGARIRDSHSSILKSLTRSHGDNLVVTGHVGPTLDLLRAPKLKVAMVLRNWSERLASLRRHYGDDITSDQIQKAQLQGELVSLWDKFSDISLFNPISPGNDGYTALNLNRLTNRSEEDCKLALQAIRGTDYGTLHRA